MAYNDRNFCWHGVISTDTEGAKAFYPQVLGWDVTTTPMGDGEATMFAAGGIPRLHLSEPPMEGVPSHWDNYLKVEDVDASTAAALTNGGTQIVPPTDIPVGRFSVVASPSGAVFSLFTEGDPATAENPPAAEGGIHWVELHSKDVPADLVWLEASFGITTQTMPMGDFDYTLLMVNGEQMGGAMPQQNPEAPSMWLTWIQVPNVDSAVDTAKSLGGNVLSPAMEVQGIGRMSVLADPTGGVFGVITPPASA